MPRIVLGVVEPSRTSTERTSESRCRSRSRKGGRSPEPFARDVNRAVRDMEVRIPLFFVVVVATCLALRLPIPVFASRRVTRWTISRRQKHLIAPLGAKHSGSWTTNTTPPIKFLHFRLPSESVVRSKMVVVAFFRRRGSIANPFGCWTCTTS